MVLIASCTELRQQSCVSQMTDYTSLKLPTMFHDDDDDDDDDDDGD